VVGLSEDDATDKLRRAGFEVDSVLDAQTVGERGTVLAQTPAAGTTQPEGTTVVITVSDYETPTPTPTPTPTASVSPSPSPGVTPTPTRTP
jgi:serine/threonine-protein kinase